jgi:twitching motility protein PilU
MWRLQNRAAPAARREDRALLDQVDEPSFTDITLDVRH